MLQFSWQAQHFGRVHRHFSWQAQHFRRVVLSVFANRVGRAASRKLQNFSFSKVSKQVVMSFCVAGAALCDIPSCLITC